MDQIENIEEYEFFDYESFRFVVGVVGRYRGHRLCAHASVSDETRVNESSLMHLKEILYDELFYQAEKLKPVMVEKTLEDQYDEFLQSRQRMVRDKVRKNRLRREAECELKFDWSQEGF